MNLRNWLVSTGLVISTGCGLFAHHWYSRLDVVGAVDSGTVSLKTDRQPIVPNERSEAARDTTPSTLKAIAAASASSGRFAAVAPSWRRIGLDSSVKESIKITLASKDPFTLTLAARLLAICRISDLIAAENRSAATGDFARTVASRELIPLVGSQQELLEANGVILNACTGMSDGSHDGLVEEVRKGFVTSENKLQKLVPAASKGFSAGARSESRLASIGVLLDPVNQAHLVDAALTTISFDSLVGRAGEMPPFDAAVARHLVYRELTGDIDPKSLQNNYMCVAHAVCALDQRKTAAARENPIISKSVDELLAIIRTQNWTSLRP